MKTEIKLPLTLQSKFLSFHDSTWTTLFEKGAWSPVSHPPISCNLNGTAQEMKFSVKDFLQKIADMFTFTKEIFSGKLHSLCSVYEDLQVDFFCDYL